MQFKDRERTEKGLRKSRVRTAKGRKYMDSDATMQKDGARTRN